VLSVLLQACNILFLLFKCLLILLSLALTIASEHSFWLKDHTFPSNLKQAAKIYIKSATALSVAQQIHTAFQDKSSDIPNIIQGDQYEQQIALPLSDIVMKNLLGMYTATFYNLCSLHSYLDHKK
jgi:hypothetical protein